MCIVSSDKILCEKGRKRKEHGVVDRKKTVKINL